MAVELATAYISLIPTAKNIKPAMEKQFAPAQAVADEAGRESGNKFASAFTSATSRLGSALAGTLKMGLTVASTVTAAAGAVGVKTAAQLEQADISFTTMLGSGEKAKAFIADLSKFASKTPFDLPGLQTSASSLVSAGIDASKVIPIMTSLGNATSGMGTGAEGIQRATVALQQMNAAGKIQAEDLNQLRDAGIPVYDLLTAATGKSTAEIAEMADKGKLGRQELEQLMTALETGKGLERFNGLMEKQSASLTGMWSTAKDTFSTGMAEVVQPAIPLIKEGLGGATAFLSDIILPKAQVALSETVGGIYAFQAAWTANDGDVTSSGFPGLMEKTAFFLHDVGDGLGKLDFSSLDGFLSSVSSTGGEVGPVLSDVGNSLAGLWPAVKEFSAQAPTLATGGLKLLAGALGFLSDHVDTIIDWMPLIVAGFVAWRVAQIALNAAAAITPGIQLAVNISRISAARAEMGLAAAHRTSAAALATSNGATVVQGAVTQNATRQTIAQRIATVATSIAQRAAAAGQWLLNAAMSANPIAIVVLAIGALVAGLVWFFTQTELGQQIIQNVWGAIQVFIGATVAWFQTYVLPVILDVFRNVGAIFEWLWTNIVSPVFGFIGAAAGAAWLILQFVFQAVVAIVQNIVAPALMWLWQNVFQPVFGFIGSLISAWWNFIVMPIFNAASWFIQNVLGPVFVWLYQNVVKPQFDAMGAAIKWVWDFVIKPVFDTLSDFVMKTIPKAFEDGVGFVKTAWEKLQDIAKAPVRFVVDTVINDGLIGAFNTVADFLKIDKLPRVSLPAGFADGGYTGDGGKYEPKGVVHGGEFVFTKEQTKRGGVRNLYALARSLTGYATGGLVHPVPSSVVSQGFHGGHNGIDFAAPEGTPVRAAGPGRVSMAGWSAHGGGNEIHIDHPNGLQTWYAHLSRFAVQLGQMVNGGTRIGDVGSTGNSTGAHLHYMVLNGGWPSFMNPAGFLGDGGDMPAGGTPWNPISGLIDSLMDGFKTAFPQSGAFVDLVGGVGKRLLTDASDFITHAFDGSSDDRGNVLGATLYDGGGWLEKTAAPQLVHHRKSKPDAVLSDSQWGHMAQIARNADEPKSENHFHGPFYGDPEHIAEAIEVRKRRAAVRNNLRAITVGG